MRSSARSVLSVCCALLASCSNGQQKTSSGRSASGNTAPQRPNIVLILLDDLDQMTSPFWVAMPKTAQLIRDRGLTFERSFAPNPLCCPARATLLTGLCSHNNGVQTNAGSYGGWAAFRHPLDPDGKPMLDETGQPIDNERRTIAVYLQQAGYRTTLIGKYLNGYDGSSVPVGWSEWHAFVPVAFLGHADTFYLGYNYTMLDAVDGATPARHWYGSSPADYSTDVVRDKAVDFIQRAANQPFFMYVAPTAPHSPLEAAPRHQALAQQWVGKLPKRPNYDEPDVSDKSTWLRNNAALYSAMLKTHLGGLLTVLNPEDEFPVRMGTLYAADDMVAAIVNALGEANQLDRTVLVFASDNGYNLGAHRLIEKMTPYEESLRVPLVVAGPGVRQGVTQLMTAHQDYAPTFLDLASVAIPAQMNGRSFARCFRQADNAFASGELDRDLLIGTNTVGTEIAAEAEGLLTATEQVTVNSLVYPPFRGLRTSTHTYIEWYPTEPHEYELYDLRLDPYQQMNLLSTAVGRFVTKDLVAKLQARLDALKTCAGQGCL